MDIFREISSVFIYNFKNINILFVLQKSFNENLKIKKFVKFEYIENMDFDNLTRQIDILVHLAVWIIEVVSKI